MKALNIKCKSAECEMKVLNMSCKGKREIARGAECECWIPDVRVHEANCDRVKCE